MSAFCKRRKNSGLLKALLILLLLDVSVVPSRIRGTDALTNHHLLLIDSRCNHREHQLTKRYSRGRNHVIVHSSALFVTSATVENQNFIHDKTSDENYNSRRKKETQNNNNDNSHIRPHLRQLLQLCRPINFPVVVILHLLGVHQSAQIYQKSHMPAVAATTSSSISLLVTLLKDPAMIMVLLSLLLVTSTSMITNDYYDARDGVDSPHDMRHPLAASATTDAATAATIPLPHHGSDSTITERVIPLSVAKYFTKCLYAILLLSSAFVPSIMARILVLGGAMITYLYTVHLKPITWIKNISCAALVSLGPITSGCAAWHVLRSVIGSVDVILPWFCILQSPLSFLVISLFFGIMGREVLMDIIDCVGDAHAGIKTIPVRYGKRIAANVALVCSLISSISACVLPMWILCSRMLLTMRGGGSPLGLITGSMTRNRKLLLSLLGSGMLLRRVYDVWWTNGEDNTLVNRAVDESLLSVLLVLASFL